MQSSVTVDSNWRWLHKVGTTTNCFTGNEWDTSLCPDPVTCASNCALDGADYAGTYGVKTSGKDLTLGFVTQGPYSKNVGSRLYMMEDENNYKIFKLLNQEFTFDVDVSNLPCGLNGALYFVEMAADGGASEYSGNKAGAKYGTGYCDAQCPHDLKFINGEANVEGWNPSPSDPNAGVGHYGTCCTEMDIWESNKISQALTPHACTVKGQTRCEGKDCGDDSAGQRYDGVCDKDGCDWNPYRLGDKTFFGPGFSGLDSTKPMTVVTQFHTNDGTSSGDLVEIRRLYTQNGAVIVEQNVTVGGQQFDSITDKFCNVQKTTFNDTDAFESKGGLTSVGEALGRGMVLVMSLWDDHSVNMLWLDSVDPPTAPASQPGAARGTCSTSSGKPADVEKNYPSSSVTYSNIKVGDIGSTYGPSPSPSPSPSGCPGGSLQACMAMCPSSPPAAYKACVQDCANRCT